MEMAPQEVRRDQEPHSYDDGSRQMESTWSPPEEQEKSKSKQLTIPSFLGKNLEERQRHARTRTRTN
ncbi:hypothetical protein UVI_02023760 [Ustilaginoidea virens]|uniref:Uncharacterized protein n=1 Tax=Ustilaginoidea virens TaxID=1159556 RepID=A0A1B5KZH8_USTVR|nr:hypothetical protein UVI_02023760 [Ustilaginoidea virens]